MLITRKLEFDAGHRIPDHRSLCRHLHGHRYVIEVTVSGDLTQQNGNARNGMVADFSELKSLVRKLIVDQWDHAFLAYKEDKIIVDFLKTLPEHRTVLFAVVPTAENLALEAFRILERPVTEICDKNLRLENVRIYETPNCWADARRPD